MAIMTVMKITGVLRENIWYFTTKAENPPAASLLLNGKTGEEFLEVSFYLKIILPMS